MQILEDIYQQVSHHSSIDVLEFDAPRVSSDYSLENVLADLGVQIHPTLVDFYSTYQSFNLLWTAQIEINQEVIIIDGHINILPLNDVINGPNNRKWEEVLWFTFQSKEEQEALIPLRPFDMFYADDTNCSCLTMKDNCLGDNVIMSSVDYGLHNLSINIEKYFELLCITRGFVQWPFLISEKKNLHKYENFLQEYSQSMETLFPGTNQLLK